MTPARQLKGLSRPFSPQAYRQITRPLIRADGSFDRKLIFAEARRRFDQAARWREPISWSKALTDAWDMAHRQIDLARCSDASPRESLPLAA